MTTLADFMGADARIKDFPGDVSCLADAIVARYGVAVKSVLLYGSCRRQTDLDEGLVDLLVIVSGYRDAFGPGLAGLLNWLLPPNVYYLEAPAPGGDLTNTGKLRCKYAVISERQFARRVRSRTDHYFWARFCQPMRQIAGSDIRSIALARAEAARSFASRIAPLVAEPLQAEAFWSLALATTYRCELRPEPPGNARRLIDHDPGYWRQISDLLATEGLLQAGDGGYHSAHGSMHRLRTRISWHLRRISGKLYNLARLFKAAGTFANGIDYIVWKVERHSGVRIVPTERMRRHPRLAAWGLAWRMWRGGGFR